MKIPVSLLITLTSSSPLLQLKLVGIGGSPIDCDRPAVAAFVLLVALCRIIEDTSFIIIGTFVISSLAVGYIGLKNSTWDTIESISNYVWFASEAMITLGMIGTVAGFLIMLNTAFSGLDVNDIRNVQEAISDMAIGMSTALVTTLVGLVCSTLIKVQMVVYENSSNGNP